MKGNGIISNYLTDFSRIVMQSEKHKIWKLNKYMKSAKMPYIIYVDIESQLKKQMGVQIVQKIP